MPLQPVPDTMEAEVIFLLFGQRVENVYHIQALSGVDAQVLLDTATSLMNWVSTTYMPLVSDEVTFLGVEVKNLSIDNGGLIALQPPSPVSGSIAGGSMPGNVSFCLSLRTAQSGRSFRGRKYVAGVPRSVVTEQAVSSSWAADLISALTDLTTVMFAINNLIVIVSRVQAGIELLIPITTPIVSYTTTDLFTDSQRRRLTGRGS